VDSKLLFILCALLFLTGCVASGVTADKSSVQEMDIFQVIALEPPPLGMPSNVAKTTVGIHPEMAYGNLGGAVLFGILLAVEAPESAAARGEASESVEQLLSQEDAWIPTIILARLVQEELAAKGFRVAELDSGTAPIPSMEDRSYTFMMENWMAPIRQWYGSNPSEIEYARPEGPIDGVIEVGISNYEYAGKSLLLQVMVRLINPETKHVVARSRKYKQFDVGRPEEAFANQGLAFKSEFETRGKELIRKALDDMGLITE
jgi:hypothetical protein